MEQEEELAASGDCSQQSLARDDPFLGGMRKNMMAHSTLKMSDGDNDIVHDADVVDLVQGLLERNSVKIFERFDRQDKLLEQLLRSLTAASRVAACNSVIQQDMAEPKSSNYSELKLANFRHFNTTDTEDMRLKEAAKHMDDRRTLRKRTKSKPGEDQTRLQYVVYHLYFELFFAACIMANALYIGIEVQSGYLEPEEPTKPELLVFGELFTILFTVELILRIAASGRRFFFAGQWHWNYLDVFIVVTALWETILLAFGGGTSVGVSSVRVIRILRMTRLIKVTRIARVMKVVRALNTLVQSIIFTLRSLVWAMVLLFLLLYVFGIIFTQAVSDAINDPNVKLSDDAKKACEIYWAGLPFSMLSLFMSISGGVSWELVIAPLHEISGVWSLVFLFYISFTYFAVLNVVTGVFCQSAIDSAQSDHELVMHSIILNKASHVEKIKSLFQEIDCEERGYITFKEFDENVHKPAVQTWFESLELDVNDAWNFFKLLDSDGGASIEVEEFLMGCLRLRGGARALDMAQLMHEQRKLAVKQSDFRNFVEDSLRSIASTVAALSTISPKPGAE
eukprot:TRINITY_DN62698_c0_g1_i1.p1 TRINITY_DN62698_c0_g1~~TRINITY_DN62698_c0_g1_i1.p1  ORF type:complete len:566 (+),score=85.67 TRINITY_DN62698_c0_g1_i1:83-1780(+)